LRSASAASWVSHWGEPKAASFSTGKAAVAQARYVLAYAAVSYFSRAASP